MFSKKSWVGNSRDGSFTKDHSGARANTNRQQKATDKSKTGNFKSNPKDFTKPAYENVEKIQKPSDKSWIGDANGGNFAKGFKLNVPHTSMVPEPEVGWGEGETLRERLQRNRKNFLELSAKALEQRELMRGKQDPYEKAKNPVFKNLSKSGGQAKRQRAPTITIDTSAANDVHLNQELSKQGKSPGFLAVPGPRSRQAPQDYGAYEDDDDIELEDLQHLDSRVPQPGHRRSQQADTFSDLYKLPAMAVLKKQYANAGLDIPSLDSACKTLMEPPGFNPVNRSTTSRETNTELEYIWDRWSSAAWDKRPYRSSRPESKSPASEYKPPGERHDAGEPTGSHMIIAEMIKRLVPFLKLEIAPAELNFDRLDKIFTDESFSYTLSRLNAALDRLASSESTLGRYLAGLGNINIPASWGEWLKVRFGNTDVGLSVDLSMSPSRLKLEVHLQLRQLLQMIKTHMCREKNLVSSVEEDTKCEISMASSDRVSIKDSWVWGRQQINNWKLGAGRANSWRFGPSTKALTRRKRAKCNRNNAATRAVRYRCSIGHDEPRQSESRQADLPVAALRSCEARLAGNSNRRWRYAKILDVNTERIREKILPNRVPEDIEAKKLAEDNMDIN